MKKAIVLGASSGIGRQLALKLSNAGYRVGIAARRAELLDEIVESSNGAIISQTMDLSVINAIPAKLEELISELGGMDLLVLSSGVGELNKDLEFALEQKTIELNVEGFTAVLDYAYNYFATRGGGHIVAISSVMGLRGSCAAPAYSASKAYQINYLEALRQRAFVQKNNIHITDVRPGSVDTQMMKGEGHFWIATPERAAEQTLRAISKRRSVVYVTKRWRLIGWLLKMLPTALYRKTGKL